ncbi:MAG: fatty acid desaturase [Planctomycetaceae bacterium]
MTSNLDSREVIKKLHITDRSATIKNVLDLVIFFVFGGVAIFFWKTAMWPISVLAWLTAGHFGHSKPLMFHDAAHGTLHSSKRMNEIVGFGIGTLILVPMTVYRHAHSMHHAYLSTRRDPELWPFTIPEVPRWQRLVAAAVEIVFGFLYTPFLMLLSLRSATGLPRRDKIRIALEYLACAALWSLFLIAATITQTWEYFLVGYIAPVAVAGMYQTLNKYTEHLGLTGDSILSNTRTVAADSTAGQIFSYTLQHVDHHGTHHRFAKIPYYNLPQATPIVYEQESGPLYRNYWSAFFDMVRCLPDPKAGFQWREHEAFVANSARTGRVLQEVPQHGIPMSRASG